MLNTRFDYHQLNFRLFCRENIAEDFFENIKLMFSASKMSWEAQRLWQTVALWAESSSAVLRFLNMALCWNGIHRQNPIYRFYSLSSGDNDGLPKDGMRYSSHFQTAISRTGVGEPQYQLSIGFSCTSGLFIFGKTSHHLLDVHPSYI